MDEKIKKYNSTHKGLLSNTDTYVIAISGAEIDGFMMDEQLIMEAVAGIRPIIHMPFVNGKPGDAFRPTCETVPNPDGRDIDTGIFNFSTTKEIGAIMFLGKDVISTILNETESSVMVVHNPNVVQEKKIDPSLFMDFRQIVINPTNYQYIS